MVTIGAALSIGLLSLPVRAAGASAPADLRAARPLQIVRDSGTLEGTCAIVYADPVEDDVLLYFVTASRLFKTAEGEPLAPARAVRVTLEDGSAVSVRHEDVFLPVGNFLDVAVLRAVAPRTASVSGTMTFSVPPPGREFLIAGYDRGGVPATVIEHVRFVSTRLVVGDRDASGLMGCVGAPAISADGIFGIVTECDVNRAPIVMPLAVGYSFLARHVPDLMIRPTATERR